MFGLFGKKKTEPTETTGEETAIPAGAREINRLAMLRAQIAAQSNPEPSDLGTSPAPAPEATAPLVATAAPSGTTASTPLPLDDQFVRLPLGVVLKAIPREALSQDVDVLVALPTSLGAEVNLPAPQVIHQLSTGSVQFALGALLPQIPKECLVPEPDIAKFRSAPIKLQLSEVFSRIPPDLITIRPDQIKIPTAPSEAASAFQLINDPQGTVLARSGSKPSDDDDEPEELVIHARPPVPKQEPNPAPPAAQEPSQSKSPREESPAAPVVELPAPTPLLSEATPKESLPTATSAQPPAPSLKPVPAHAKKSPAGEISLGKELPPLVVESASSGQEPPKSQVPPPSISLEDIIFPLDPDIPPAKSGPVTVKEPVSPQPIEPTPAPKAIEPEPLAQAEPEKEIPEAQSAPVLPKTLVEEPVQNDVPAAPSVVSIPIVIPPKRISLDDIVISNAPEPSESFDPEAVSSEKSIATDSIEETPSQTNDSEAQAEESPSPLTEQLPPAAPLPTEPVADSAAQPSVAPQAPSLAANAPEPEIAQPEQVSFSVSEPEQMPEPVAAVPKPVLPEVVIPPIESPSRTQPSLETTAPEPALTPNSSLPQESASAVPPVATPTQAATQAAAKEETAQETASASGTLGDDLARARRALARWLGDPLSGPLIMADVPKYLNQLPYVKGSALVDGDGLLLASLLPKEVTASAVSGLTGKLFGQVTEMAKELGAGETPQVLVSAGRWVLHITHRRAFYLVVFLGTSNPPASLLRRLDKILMALERQELGS
jgi:predicted regulator of Ras-like GTPase activity (Roadblock/LC7/MglB family)